MHSNRLLMRLRRKDLRQLIAACDEVDLSIGDVLCKPQSRLQHVYFPIHGFVSQRLTFDDRNNLELALVGDEGMLCAPLVLGVNTTILQAQVQGSGVALRMRAASFRNQLEQLPELRQLLNRYLYVLQAQLAVTAACNRFHSLNQRLARWLLMNHDCSGLGSFHLTHKFLSQMLGVRREGVTIAAGLLHKQEILSYRRGDITVLNRTGLERISCTCYQTSKEIYASVLG